MSSRRFPQPGHCPRLAGLILAAAWPRAGAVASGALAAAGMGLALGLSSIACAQGGGNANSVGLSLEAATKAAGANSTTSGGTPPAAPASAPPMSAPSGPPSSGESPYPSGYDPTGSGGDPSSEYGGNYGNGEMGYGGPSPSGGNHAQRAQIAMMTVSQRLARSLAEFFTATPSEAEAGARQLTLWEQAALSLYRGDQRKALALYHAHVVADGEAAAEARSAVMYSRLLKRPVWLVRFGLSIHPRVPEEFASDPEPIRQDTRIASANPRMRGIAGQAGGPEESYGGPPEEYSGEDPSGMMGPPGTEYDGGLGGPAAKPVVTTLGGASTEQVKTAVDRNLGLVADVTAELFTALHSAGKFGHALDSMEAKGAALAAINPAAGDFAPSDLPMWIPGVDYVGEGSYIEMLAKAKESEIDVLMHFDVIVKANRAGPPQYTTRCRLFHVDSGDTIVISKAIDKYEIASKPGDNRVVIHEIMSGMFEIVDKKIALEPMPALQAQHATARIESLLASKKPDTLRNLAEMVMFRSRDLVTAEQLDKAIYFAGSDAALQLIHDEETQRYERANIYVEQELNKAPTP